MSIRVSTLANGLCVATDTMNGVETASLGVYIGVGTRHEVAETNGVAHLLEHMAFKGTTTRSARQIAEEIEAVGGQMNAQTGREQTAYYVKVLKEDVALGLDILADILLRSVYDPQEFERERGVILQELGQVEDTPDDAIFDRFHETAFPGQALGRPILGRAETIAGLPRATLVDYRQRHYGARNMVLAAAGRIEHERLVAMAAAAFADLPPAGENGSEAARYAGGEFRAEEDLEQVHFVLGFPGVSFTDPDYYSAAVLATLLGGGMSSRLFQEIRERRGLCYTISAFSASYLDGGIFGVYTGTGERETAEMIPVLAEEMRAVTAPIDAEEIRRARAQMKAGLLMSLESTNARMDALGSNILIYGRPIPPDEISRCIDAVTPEDITRVARRLFVGRPTIAAMGPLGGLEPYARLARRFG
ncbi:MAG: insulinase family protein [Rhodospirillales bacterium]|nr:insulinase family protein [Rhodospirillales bacterium]